MAYVHLNHLHRPRPLVNLCSPPITTVHSHSFPIQTPKSTAPIHLRTPSIRHRNTIKCMAKPRRVQRIAKQIERELSDMLLTDKVLQEAIMPEAALGADMYLSSLATISDVVVTSDLQVVKVYVSVFGDARGKEVAIAGLKSKAKYVRGQLAKRMRLRLAPEIRFMEDESAERGSRVLAILDRIKAEKEKAGEQVDEITEPQDDEYGEGDDPKPQHDEQNREGDDSKPQDDEDWEGDEPDEEEDIIYVK